MSVEPFQMWTQGFYNFAQPDYATVREILDPNSVNFQHYGIDDDGPLPSVQTQNLLKYQGQQLSLQMKNYKH